MHWDGGIILSGNRDSETLTSFDTVWWVAHNVIVYLRDGNENLHAVVHTGGRQLYIQTRTHVNTNIRRDVF